MNSAVLELYERMLAIIQDFISIIGSVSTSYID